MVILLYFLSLLSSLSIGMRKQFQRDHNIATMITDEEAATDGPVNIDTGNVDVI